ncbi:hypothetical protein C8F04DRAFT_1185696 [Mycena alexandri]|uniref:Uncharacterized protein n=1 Tax=Mycena alexandri TaxID=1745969 RepID=A0AAD6SPL0_9AGAR|nr:hypothetical protein C8F04DRAFT_1185696 [Mycena alexandri]
MKEGRKMPYNCRGPNKEQKIIRFDPAYRRSAPTKYRQLSSYRERGYERQGSRDLRKRRRAIDKIPCTTVTCGVTALEPPLSFITIMVRAEFPFRTTGAANDRSPSMFVSMTSESHRNCLLCHEPGREKIPLDIGLIQGSGSGSDPLPLTLELRKDIRLLPMINLLGRYIFGLVTQMRRQLEAIYNNGSHRDRSSLIPRENGRAVFTLILFPLRMRITLTSRRRVLFAKHGDRSAVPMWIRSGPASSLFHSRVTNTATYHRSWHLLRLDFRQEDADIKGVQLVQNKLPSRAPVYTLNRAVYPPARPWLAHQLLPAGFRIPSADRVLIAFPFAETSQSFGGKIEPGKSKLERFPTEVLSEILAATAQKYPDSHLDILESVVTRGNILLLSKRMAEADIYSNGSSLTIAGSNKPLNPPLITHLDIDFQSSPIWANILRMAHNTLFGPSPIIPAVPSLRELHVFSLLCLPPLTAPNLRELNVADPNIGFTYDRLTQILDQMCHDIEILRLNSDRGNHLRTEVYREMRDRVLAGYIRGGPTNITEVTFSSPPPSNAGGLTARRAFASLAKRGSQVKGDCVRFHQRVFRVRVLGCQGYFPPHIDTNAMELFKKSNRIGDSLVAAQVYETINGSQLIRASYSIVLAFTDENETERVFNSGIWQGGVRRRAEKFFPWWDDGIGGYV